VVGAEGDDPESQVKKLLQEINQEKTTMETRRTELDRLESSLRTFQSELDQRAQALTQQEAQLKKREEEFATRVDAKSLDRKMIETFEAIDPDQGAILILNLQRRDATQAAVLLRRMTGKKAGKLLESLIQLDPAAATELAKGSLDLYKLVDNKPPA
jgi:hypothetical protein